MSKESKNKRRTERRDKLRPYTLSPLNIMKQTNTTHEYKAYAYMYVIRVDDKLKDWLNSEGYVEITNGDNFVNHVEITPKIYFIDKTKYVLYVNQEIALSTKWFKKYGLYSFSDKKKWTYAWEEIRKNDE